MIGFIRLVKLFLALNVMAYFGTSVLILKLDKIYFIQHLTIN